MISEERKRIEEECTTLFKKHCPDDYMWELLDFMYKRDMTGISGHRLFYIFIEERISKAEKFLSELKDGVKEYKNKIAEKKTILKKLRSLR